MSHALAAVAGRCLRACVLLALAGGCTYVNRQLNDCSLPLEQRKVNHTRSATMPAADPAPAALPRDRDDCFFGIAISGGGSRSANFSAACLFELQRLGLLEHCDYISAVSGGSLTAAWYCSTTADQWNPQAAQRKLTHDFATDLIVEAVQPWNTLWLWATDWDITDVLARSFERTLFTRDGRGLTFADLRPDRPRLLVNATDLQSGRRFVFCNESFDELNSDLSRYPLAYAAAASSAVPVLLHHVTVRDFSTRFKAYRHFIDGGVTDNLGVQTLVEVYEGQKRAAAARKAEAYRRGAVFLIIDAKTSFNANISTRGDIGIMEAVLAGAGLTSTALLNRASSATMADLIVRYADRHLSAEQIRGLIHALERQGHVQMQDHDGRPVRIVHLSLGKVRDLSVQPFPGYFETLENIRTYYNISDADAYQLYQAAHLLMKHRYDALLEPLARELREAAGPPAATAPAR